MDSVTMLTVFFAANMALTIACMIRDGIILTRNYRIHNAHIKQLERTIECRDIKIESLEEALKYKSRMLATKMPVYVLNGEGVSIIDKKDLAPDRN